MVIKLKKGVNYANELAIMLPFSLWSLSSSKENKRDSTGVSLTDCVLAGVRMPFVLMSLSPLRLSFQNAEKLPRVITNLLPTWTIPLTTNSRHLQVAQSVCHL